MEIINRTHFDIGKIENYEGICENCATPLEYEGDMIVSKVQDTETAVIFVPLDRLFCPECGKEILKIIANKTLDITDELKGLKPS